MFVGLGTIINVLAILIGTLIGRTFGNRLKANTRELLTDVLGAITLIGAGSAVISLFQDELVDAVPSGFPILIVLASLILGGLLGSALQLENRINGLGESIKARYSRTNSGVSNESFVEGFVTASLIFVIGPLAILGSISDGMSTGIDQLILKSVLDLFASIAFAATFGWSVAFSAIPVAIYQGLWTVAGFILGSFLLGYQIQAMTATGGVLLFGIALKLLRIKNIAIGDLLPALALAPLLALIATRF